MNHLVRTEAKRIYQKIRRNLASKDAESICERALPEQSIPPYSEINSVKSSSRS